MSTTWTTKLEVRHSEALPSDGESTTRVAPHVVLHLESCEQKRYRQSLHLRIKSMRNLKRSASASSLQTHTSSTSCRQGVGPSFARIEKSRGGSAWVVRCSLCAQDAMENYMFPTSFPMLVPPRNWTSYNKGAYLKQRLQVSELSLWLRAARTILSLLHTSSCVSGDAHQNQRQHPNRSGQASRNAPGAWLCVHVVRSVVLLC